LLPIKHKGKQLTAEFAKSAENSKKTIQLSGRLPYDDSFLYDERQAYDGRSAFIGGFWLRYFSPFLASFAFS